MPRIVLPALLLVCAAGLRGDVERCACNPAVSGGLAARECSLCGEAEKHPADAPFFFLKDNNPRKPNRWLLLPRQHSEGMHDLSALSKPERTALWQAAIEKGKELWGEEWGLAYNGQKVRTQCHLHIHIGKLLKGVETGKVIVVRNAAEIPVPKIDGLWIHPHGRRLHVHVNEQTCETVLLR